jgi:hypothetical protein
MGPRTRPRRKELTWPLVLALLVPGIALVGCGGSHTPATPAESPTPTPAPTPEPTPLPPQSLGCGLPPVANPAVSCPRTSGSYQGIVTEALARLVAQHPGLFDLDDQQGPLGYYVKDHAAYYEGVLLHIREQGACAVFDGEEIAVKMNNDFSDQYKILTSSSHIQTGPSVYRATCAPPAF